MTENEMAEFKRLLEARRSELQTLSSDSAASRKPVELDQQSVGRLSRQDALQQQAMANAQEARRAAELHKIDAALERLAAGDYGWCEECGEAIAQKRLKIDLTALHCAGCAGALSG